MRGRSNSEHNVSETVYIETSVIGYLTARMNNNLILMANVEATREWWVEL